MKIQENTHKENRHLKQEVLCAARTQVTTFLSREVNETDRSRFTCVSPDGLSASHDALHVHTTVELAVDLAGEQHQG